MSLAFCLRRWGFGGLGGSLSFFYGVGVRRCWERRGKGWEVGGWGLGEWVLESWVGSEELDMCPIWKSVSSRVVNIYHEIL